MDRAFIISIDVDGLIIIGAILVVFFVIKAAVQIVKILSK